MRSVKYIGCSDAQTKWGSNDDPRDILVVGQYYNLLREEIHTWHTKYILTEFPDMKFNSVNFED